MKARRWYALHRWLNAVVGLQLLAWAAGGLVFATHDIGWVRGKVGQTAPPADLDLTTVRLTPAQAAARAPSDAAVERVVLRRLLDRAVYEVHRAEGPVALVAADDGTLLSPLDQTAAVAVALADREGSPAVLDVEHVGADPPIEYRGKPLPAWRVAIDDGQGTNLWVSADEGRVTARRNDAWRRFDLFWMLHTMDWSGRDDFNHPVLIVFASLGLLSALTGLALWAFRVVRWRRRRTSIA